MENSLSDPLGDLKRLLGDVIYLCPPLSVTKEDLDEILKRMFKIIKELEDSVA